MGKRTKIARRRVIALVAVGFIAAAWLLGHSQLAEALNGWTVHLAEMTLADYPPGYGEPTPY